MGNQPEMVYIAILRWPSRTEMRFGHKSKAAGHQIWDSAVWLMGDTPMTERALLQELYAGVLEFQERRA